MKKINIETLELDIYSEKLDNGLEVYIVPKNNVTNIYATYSTRYGGINNEFIPVGEKEMITVPKGIAHFLEHKMFEEENGDDVFKFFSERGADCNAFTSSKKTSYLFSGSNAFYENLEYLLSYVEAPYFTDENVEKEKGIIKQEIMMYKDSPFSVLYEGLMNNIFINHPYKYPTIGTVESINSITKEDLYKCYNTFYHPANMFVVITGNVDPKKTIDLIKEHENKRKLKNEKIIVEQVFEEPDNVDKKEEVREMNVTSSKVAIAYKINVSKIKNMDIVDITNLLRLGISLKLGDTSLFAEDLRNNEYITDGIDVSAMHTDKHVIILIDVETKFASKVIGKIRKELKSLDIAEHEFERTKKCSISSLLYLSDNIVSINNKIMSDIINYNMPDINPIARIKSKDIGDYNYIIDNINMENFSTYIINPIEQDN